MVAAHPFADPDTYLDTPRTAGLALSPDGTRLVTVQSTLSEDRTRFETALWSIDPAGRGPARRLTYGAPASDPVFAADGRLLFRRAADTADSSPKASTALWALDFRGGEPQRIAHRAGGVDTVRCAARSDRIVVTGPVLGDPDRDEQVRALRDKGVTAILHAGYPMRHWDADLGPAVTHLFDVVGGGGIGGPDGVFTSVTPDAAGPSGGGVYRDTEYDVSTDGAVVVATRRVSGADGVTRHVLVRIGLRDGAGGAETLVDEPHADQSSPRISPDGARVAYLRTEHPEPDAAPRVTAQVLDLATGRSERWGGDWDRWPTALAWTADSSALLATADDHGHAPIFRVDRASATRLTDDGAFTDLQVAPGGDVVFALRASYLAPPHPVRLSLTDGTVTALPTPAPLPTLPGFLEDVDVLVADGTRVRAWLALPEGTSPEWQAPLVLWVHGGPLGSWNTWSWRWNPWMLVAAGYAVLMPDPALSTGYGQQFVQRGWGRWGAEVYTDLTTITDAVIDRPDIDSTRTAMMGGSFGGYMANWMAGHTDRFRAIVSHAGLWALDQFGPTTDEASYWAHEMTPEMAFENSPHLSVAEIITPMLITHGDKDFRVPIGESLRLWWELLSESASPADENGETVHRFLYFPDENHWILKPPHIAVWYGAVLAFLSTHVLGRELPMPAALGVRPGRTGASDEN